MYINLFLKRIADGAIARVKDYDEGQKEYSWDDIEFSWSEGNFSCDCNRKILFDRSVGIRTNHKKLKCGHQRYKLMAVADNGDVIYKEDGY